MPKVIVCHGIGESTTSWSMLRSVTALLSSDWEVVWLKHPSSYGMVGEDPLAGDFMSTLVRGQEMLRAELDKGPAIIVGYSAGAAIVGHVAAAGHSNIVAVALLADPFQPMNVIGSRPNRWGVARSREINGVVNQGNGRVRWWFDVNDVICQCPGDSPIRTLSDQTRWMSLGDPARWVRNVVADLQANRFQAVLVKWWNPRAVIAQYAQAGVDALGYLPRAVGGRGDHTEYHLRKRPSGLTAVQEMAVYIRAAWTEHGPRETR